MSEEAVQRSNVSKVLHDHKTNKFNRERVDVHTMDELANDGAYHEYRIVVGRDDGQDNLVTDLKFQNGGLKEVGPNGITDQALIAIVIDRVRCFNDGPYRCRENSMVITKLEEALLWMEKRSNDRARRGVEGERAV